MATEPLNPLAVLSLPDQTGKNPGHLTTHFSTGTVGMPGVNVWELYHMTVTGGPPAAQANILIAGKVYSTVVLDAFGTNEWDPQQPAEIRGDQEIYFLWNIPTPGTPGQIPTVTIWPRWDPSSPSNKGLMQT